MTTENNNKNLNVPNLRFPEFSGEWEKYRLKDIANISKERIGINMLSNNNYISTENMKPDFGGVDVAINLPVSGNVIKFQKGDTLLSNIRPYLKKIWQAKFDGGCSADIFVFRSNILCNSDFLYYTLANEKFILYAMSGAKGVKMPRGDKEQILKYDLHLPTTIEQNKIASMLSLLDDRIATQIKIIEKLESLIRGIITDVNSSRLAQCKQVYLRDLLTEQHEKNTNNYEVCSVSVSQGVINQIDYLGRSFAAKEVLHYNVVNCGDIVYTKSPTGEFPYGIVKRSDINKPVAVSPLYGVYRPINDYVGRYLHLYFKSPINAKNYLHKLIQKGAKNTINITNQHFLDNKILIPEKGWLDKIVKFAAAIEMKIATENKVLQTLQQQKDYLLSKMFI